MRIIRRQMAFIIAVVMMLALAPCFTGGAAQAADSDFTVVRGRITAYNGPGTEKFSIPDTINGETITSVADDVFYVNFNLVGSLPAGLTTVGDEAFCYCTGLTGSLPAGLTTIGICAFQGCSSLTGSLPAELTSIGGGAFYGCSGLTGNLPAGLTTVKDSAFSGCSGLTGSLPTGLRTIGSQAFSGCSGLTYILTSNVRSIGSQAFPGSAMLYVQKDSYAQQWAYDNYYNYTVYDGTPLGITSITSANTTLQSGETNTWTVESEGGIGDIRYCFYIYKDGEIIQKGKYGASDTCSFVCAEPGVYQARAYAKDVAGTVKTLKGGTVTVTSSVPAPKLASVASKYTSREVGQANRWTPKVTGGATPLQYHYRLYKDGEVYQTFGWKTDASWAFTFTEPGEYRMQVIVKDANDARSKYVKSDTITVVLPPAPVLSSVTSKYTSREVGQANRWTPKLSESSGTLQYHYRLYKDGEAYKTFGWKTDASWAFTFTEPGEYAMQVRVQDAYASRSKYVKSENIVVTVSVPKLASVATKYTEREVGQANRWTPKVTGGTGALQYHYRLYKDGAVYQTFGWKTEASYAFTFTEPGEYTMQVRVKDEKDNKSDYVMSEGITVTAPVPKAPVLSSVSTKYTSRIVGTANRWTPAVTGGSGALQYHYRLYKNDSVYQTFGWKTDASWAFTFTEPGEYVMQVRVKDEKDNKSDYVMSEGITVTAPVPKAPVLSSVATKYTSRTVGTANRWTPAVTGGTGALQYHYRLYKDGAVYQTFGWKTDASWAFTFTEPGEYTMQVIVKDGSDMRSKYVHSPAITITK